jgi:hypothetical protein
MLFQISQLGITYNSVAVALDSLASSATQQGSAMVVARLSHSILWHEASNMAL